MAQPIIPILLDNLPMRTRLIEECMPHLSLADLEAVGQAMNHRWQALKAAQQHGILVAHYATLRALPAGTRVEYLGRTSGTFTAGERVSLVRPLRKPSTNIQVADRHGKVWNMPMKLLLVETEGEPMRTALRKELEARGRESLNRALERLLERRTDHAS